MAVLGTLADRVPLVNENRTLVALGLHKLETMRMPAVRAVFEYLNATEKLTVHSFVHELLPLFAAANGADGVRKFPRRPASRMRGRGSMTSRAAARSGARSRTAPTNSRSRISWSETASCSPTAESSRCGLSGSAPTGIKDRFQMPAIVIGWRGDAWVGEGRGVEGMSLMDLLSACGEYFIDYGGHRKAAGFSMEEGQAGRVPALRRGVRAPEPRGQAPARERRDWRTRSCSPRISRTPWSSYRRSVMVIHSPCLRRGRPNWRRAATAGPRRLGPKSCSGPVGSRASSIRVSRFDLLYTLDDFGRLTIVDARPCNG